MPLINKSGFNAGTSFGVDEAGEIANLQLEVDALKVDNSESKSPGGTTSPTPAATFWVTYRAVKNDVIVTLRHAVDPNTNVLDIVLEQYVDDGSGGITVVDTKRDEIEITPDMLSVVAGVTVVEREFSKKLEQNSTYGLLRYAYTLSGNKQAMYAPAKDPPARASRVVGDYITTFNSTNGEVIARQDGSHINLIKNGRFEYIADAPAPADELRFWVMRDGAWASTVIDSTNTDDMYHDAANGALVWQDKDKALAQNFGRPLRRGEFVCCAFDIKGSSAFDFGVTADVVLQSTGVSEATAVTQTFSLTTTPQRVHLVVELSATYSANANHAIKISTTTALNNDGGGGTGRKVTIQVVMFNRGKYPEPYEPNLNESSRAGGLDPDVNVTAVMSNNDIGDGAIESGTGSRYFAL